MEKEKQPEKKNKKQEKEKIKKDVQKNLEELKESASFFKKYKNGEFSEKERKERYKKIQINGETIALFHDIGLTFYYVKPGDTIEKIKNKLSQIKEFRYIKDLPNQKTKSFNIPEKKLKANLWIPIPKEENERIITDKDFLQYAQKGLEKMKANKIYGEQIKKMINASSEKEILSLMIATAKQESGGLPLGQFEFHRWENHHQCFSYSIYHILMKGPGEKARKNLEMTKGQTYHPENASQLFLAFLIEKEKETGFIKSPADYLPLTGKNKNGEKKSEIFAKFYNGKNWKETNPKYAENIINYQKEIKNNFFSKEKHDYTKEKQEIETLWKSNPQNTMIELTENIKNNLAQKLKNFKEKSNKKINTINIAIDKKNKRVFIKINTSKNEIFLSQNLPEKKIKEKEPIQNNIEYEIQKNETLSLIALRITSNPQKKAETLQKIKELNPKLEENKIQANQKIKIPAQKIIVPDVALEKIIEKYYTQWENKEDAKKTLKALNKKNPKTGKIKPGETIIVPLI